MRAVLFDLDDTLLDYSGGVDRCWETAFRTAAPPGLDAATLMPVLAESRRWFWSDPERHRRERTDMLRAWTRIAVHTLERAGRADARRRADRRGVRREPAGNDASLPGRARVSRAPA